MFTNVEEAADLFCGAGGTSTGLLQAAKSMGKNVHMVAVNHWDLAISTHSKNHPGVKHYNRDLSDVDPLTVVPGGYLRILVASPECTYFSRARGKKTINKQSRAKIKYVLRWIGALDIEDVLIENVPEFLDWGPLIMKCTCGAGQDFDKKHIKPCEFGMPDKKRKGEYFYRFIKKLEKIGYAVDWRLLVAANYGDPTTRKRLFIQARKAKAIHWPEQTHHENGGDMFGSLPKWRSAREIIDWSISGKSIFNRKKPLADNTLKRIEAGLRKYGGEMFIIGHQRGDKYAKGQKRVDFNIHSVDEPLQTITATSSDMSLVQPFIMQMDMGGRLQSIDEPLNTITSADARALVQPFIMPVNHGSGDLRTYSLDDPMPTITGFDALGIVEPFLVKLYGTDERHLQQSSQSVDQPLPTVTGSGHIGLAEPFLVQYHGSSYEGGERTRSIDQPLPTVATSNQFGLVTPFLVEYNGTGLTASLDEPLPTVTGSDRFGLVQPMIVDQRGRRYLVDIRFRMLQPRELASGMGFPVDYEFSGNREDIVKQIGNSVPVNLATELCKSLLQS